MNGEKRFLIPGDLWDTGLLEQWLEEKALHGWFPVSFGGLRGKFVKREPQTVRFRLEPNRAETLASRQEPGDGLRRAGVAICGGLGRLPGLVL